MGYTPDGAEFAGRSYLLLSSTLERGTHSLSDADYAFDGATAWDSAGSAVLGPGDVNGDGLPDLVFGAWQGDSTTALTAEFTFLNP